MSNVESPHKSGPTQVVEREKHTVIRTMGTLQSLVSGKAFIKLAQPATRMRRV